MRKKKMVPYGVIYPLMQQAAARFDKPLGSVPELIGYSAGAASQWKAAGSAPEMVKWALVGFLTSRGVSLEPKKQRESSLTKADFDFILRCVADAHMESDEKVPMLVKLAEERTFCQK